MRRLWAWALLLLLPCGSAGADPTNLGSGVFIVHQVPELAYSGDPPGGSWCASYLPYAIDSCDAQVNRVDVTGTARVTWFVLAAWFESKEWCGTEFGLGDFDPSLFSFNQYGPCFPAGGVEIPTAGWPGPRTGTSLAVTDGPWSGNYLPVYFFTGYAYSDHSPGLIPLAPNSTTGFAGTANCLTPPGAWGAVALGGLGVGTDGIFVCPGPPQPHVCCRNGNCVLLLDEHECLTGGGVWHPEWNSCEGDPCPPPPEPGCCWVGGNCYYVTEDECVAMGGHWVPPEYCFPRARDCGGVGPPMICCIDEQCFFMVEQQCANAGGVYHAEWDSCAGDPCSPVPQRPATWGAIKALYR